jgi:hypothetical protein
MLKQLAYLSLEADGRYATAEELEFLTVYLDSMEDRIRAYKKVRELEERILYRVDMAKRALPEDMFHLGSRDITWICRYDLTMVIRCIAAAMLFNDLDRLREGMLIWYETIVRAFAYKHCTIKTYQILQDVINEYLDPADAKLLMPGLQLTHSLLSQ